MRIGAIVQARMNSRRFPGKTLHRVAGKPMLLYLIERLKRCSELAQIVVATSEEESDDPIGQFCRHNGVPCYRGPLENVARRFVGALDAFQFEAFVRIGGDSPLLDQALVHEAIDLFFAGGHEIVTNVLERTFPRGQSVELIRSDVFRAAFEKMEVPDDLEHATPYFYRNSTDFDIHNFRLDPPNGELQLSVDSAEDMDRFAAIVERMEKPHWKYGLAGVVELARQVK